MNEKSIKLRPLPKIEDDKLFFENPKYSYTEILENEKVLLKHDKIINFNTLP